MLDYLTELKYMTVITDLSDHHPQVSVIISWVLGRERGEYRGEGDTRLIIIAGEDPKERKHAKGQDVLV